MKPLIIDSEITLIPYYPNYDTALPWYQDLDVCRQVDNIDCTYSLERLQKMYSFLSTHGDCFYIQYQGVLVGNVTLRNDQEVCIVVCKDFQNKRIGRRCILKMIELAKEKGSVSRKEIEKLLGVSQSICGRLLKQMLMGGQIVQQGKGKNTRYVLQN